jgi:hypothetical protein
LEGARISSGADDVKSNRFCLFLINVQDSNESSAACKLLHNGAPDPTSASRDDGNFAVQTK